jgi:uncharacterized pyridoxal phosphate-containing UPF0001 family protein
MTEVEDQRTLQLSRGLESLSVRIQAACAESGRSPEEVTSVIVVKTWPAADARRLYELGVRDMAENRDQEARLKVAECVDLGITWHFVGQMQRNKANSVARYADFVHSVDRVPLVRSLDSGAERAGRRLSCFVQVDLGSGHAADGPQSGGLDAAEIQGAGTGASGPHRGGADDHDVREVCEAVTDSRQLDLVGLMAVAPLGEQPSSAFERLASVRERVLKSFPQASLLSAGMSGDLEEAIAIGATHVRVGSAVLGKRAHVR